MQLVLNVKRKPIATLIILCLLAAASSLMASLLFGELILPVASAFLGALFVFDSGNKRVISIITSLVIIAVDLILSEGISYVGIEIFAVALIIAVAARRGVSKAECAFWVTFTVTAFILVAMILAAYVDMKTISFDSFLDYYIELAESLREAFVSGALKVLSSAGDTAPKISAEDLAVAFDSMLSIVFSTAVIFAFFLAGVTLKLFSLLISSCGDDSAKKQMTEWRFHIEGLLNYVFWVLALISIFIGSTDSVFAVVIINLYNIFLFVFAYIGLKVVGYLLSELFKNRVLAALAIVGGLVVFSTLAVELLAYFGAASVFFRIKKGNQN